MYEYELAGDHYAMGRQNAVLVEAVEGSPGPLTQEQLRFAGECEDAVREHAPWLLEEIRGVAEAGIYDPGFARALPLTLFADPGCSVVAVSGEHTLGGRPLFGRNYDFLASFDRYSSLYRTHPEGRLAHIGCSDHWVGRHDGLNEAGLAIGHSGPPTRHQHPGFVFTLAIRAVLDTCRTVSEAAAFLGRIPHLQNTAFLVADASGDIAAVDASPDKVVTTKFTDGFGFLANQYVSEGMAAYAPADLPGNRHRARNFATWFRKHSAVGMEDVQQVLGDPVHGVCNCGDGETEDPVVTLWSWTAALGEPSIHLAKGTPDRTPYEPAVP